MTPNPSRQLRLAANQLVSVAEGDYPEVAQEVVALVSVTRCRIPH